MHTFKYPISIDGKNYYVGRTFNGAPAIYRGTEFSHKGHISEPDLVVDGYCHVNEPGVVIIVARETDDDFKSLNSLLNGEICNCENSRPFGLGGRICSECGQTRKER